MSLGQSELLYMYERLPIWIVVSVFLKALPIPLMPISIFYLEFFAGRLDRSIRDKINKLFKDIANAICRTIRVLLKLPAQLSLMASFILSSGGKQLWMIYFMTCVLLETSTCVGVSVWCPH